MRKILDVAYGKDEQQRLDLYLQDFTAPLIFYVHGGGWWRGDKRKDQPVYSALLKSGLSVASINYRLSDEKNRFPVQIDDSRSALSFLLASDYAFDKDRIGLFGSSSGAYITVKLSIENGFPVVSWSGQFDFQGFLSTHTAIKGRKMDDNPDPDKGSRALSYYKWILEQLFNNDFSNIGRATLQHQVKKGAGPLFLVNSAAELAPLDELFKMQEAYIENGLTVSTLIFPGDRHAQAYEKDAIEPSIDFLRNHLL